MAEKELFTVRPDLDYRREKIVEHYESFIWADRYSDVGDFSMVCEPSTDMISRLTPGKYVGFTESDRLMQIKETLIAEDAEGKSTLTVKGKSLENILDGRPAKVALTPANWLITGTVGYVAWLMVYQVCVQGFGISPDDAIPNLAAVDNSGTTVSINYSVASGSILERLVEICKSADLGFKITYTAGQTQIQFQVYTGTDRSGAAGVAFSKQNENLSAVSHLRSVSKFRTGAYVYSANGSVMITNAQTGPGEGGGLTRNIILVDATDITLPAGASLTSALTQRGHDVLSENKKLDIFDGLVIPTGPYAYNRDYFLGDLVALNGEYGNIQTMRVTEHIWSYESSTGFESYPTLSATGGV